MINPNSYQWNFTPQTEVNKSKSETIQGLDYAVQELLNMYATNQLPSNLSHAIVYDDPATATGAILEDGANVLDYATCHDKMAVAEYLDTNNPDTIHFSRVEEPVATPAATPVATPAATPAAIPAATPAATPGNDG